MSPAVRRLRLDLAYDGTDFDGWQDQPARRTVQGVLERVLGELQGGRAVRVHGAGRTDSGVHARGQVAHVDLATRLDDGRLRHALGCMLPDDLVCRRAATVPDRFHAREHARRKTYAYRLRVAPDRDPLDARYAVHVPSLRDDARIEDALRRLPGRRDWSGFAASSCTVVDRVRKLYEARLLRPSAEERVVVLTGDGFLHHMVRNIVGTLLWIGRGRMEPSVIESVLATGDRRLAGPTAPARGLCLERIVYADAPRSTSPGSTDTMGVHVGEDGARDGWERSS